MNRRPTARHNTAIPIHGPADFSAMRRAGMVCARVLDALTPHVRPGITTAELDAIAVREIAASGSIAAPLGYRGYPKSTCISVNEVVCHGIPGPRTIAEGDIVNIDVTVIVDGWHGDSSRMYFAGRPKPEAVRLCRTAFEALWRGIRAARPGATLGDVGHAVQSFAESEGYGVVRDYCGHGIGRSFHSPPQVLHVGVPGAGDTLRPGMFLTIEPMLNTGGAGTLLLADGWTVVTEDGGLSAQFEHTIGITDDGAETFTLSPAGLHHPVWQT